MNHKEYIIPIGEEAKEFDEIFIGVIRKQPELIRCKDCKYAKPIDSEWLECKHDKRVMKPSGFCAWAEPEFTAAVRRQLKEQEQRKEMERKK